jgi:hypothetical protein
MLQSLLKSNLAWKGHAFWACLIDNLSYKFSLHIQIVAQEKLFDVFLELMVAPPGKVS